MSSNAPEPPEPPSPGPSPRPRGASRTAYTLTALLLVAAGGGAGLLLARASGPSTLAPAAAPADLPVATQKWDDPRPAGLTITLGAPQQVVSQRAGLLTGSSCAPGGALKSGTVTFAVDGRPLLTLATSMPLWRDLPTGATGADAGALVAALHGLGQPVDGATVTAAVVAAYDTVAKAAGAAASGGTIARDALVWIPQPASTVVTCDAAIGTALEPGRPLASLRQPLVGARLTTTPGDLVPGARVFSVGTRDLTLGDGGVDAEGLAWLAAHPEQQQPGATPTVTGTLKLATPLDVLPIPPSALGPVSSAGASCVTTPDGPRPVTVVGSQLGTAFVQPGPGSPIGSVVIDPARQRTCR